MSQEEKKTIAEELSAARQVRDLDLEEVQRQTGISLVVLQGLESGRFDVVEPVFARLALQSYAEYLGLDPEPFLSRFDQQHGRAFRPRRRPVALISQPVHRHRSRAPLIITGLIVGVCCLLVLGYYFFSRVAAAPSLDEGTVAPAQSTAPTQATDPQPAAILNDAPLVQSSTEPDTSDAPAAAATAASAAAAQTTELTPVVLELEARDSTWVQIRWDDAKEKFEGTIPPGERHRFEAGDHFVVLSTNPHGLRYWLDGQLLGGGQLGDPNQVLHFRAATDGIKLLGPDLQPPAEEAPDAQP